MPKTAAIVAALFTLIFGAANAQQREAVLHKFAIANADFDIIVAIAKLGTAPMDLRSQPDPNVVYLMGGELVHPAIGELPTLVDDLNILLAPACAFNAQRSGRHSNSVAVYVVPKAKAVDAAQN